MNIRKAAVMGALAVAMATAGAARGQVFITEYIYSATDGEFVELTNTGGAPIDLTGWSLDDDSLLPGTVDLSGFGVVAPGQSVIITESLPSDFDTAWGLGGSTLIVQNATAGLGRNDTIVIFDDTGSIIDRLDYGDQSFPGSPRAQDVSSWVCAGGLGANDPFQWNASVAMDVQGSALSAGGDLGSPGSFVSFVCAPPPTGACCTVGTCADTVTQLDCEVGGGVYQGDASECVSITCPQPTDGDIRITEYMYTGSGAEFVEFTNFDTTPINLTGWSFDDDSQTPGTVDLSALGTLTPGESGILTDGNAADFEVAWGLSGVNVAVNALAGLGRADEINLFNASDVLKDRLTYGDQTFPGTIRTNGVAGWPCSDVVGANDITAWQFATVGDSQGSYVSADGDVGNPGAYVGVACQNLPTGACCDVGVCTDETGTSCILGGRDFQGDLSDCGSFVCPLPTGGAMRITEYMYSGTGGEFIEFTNLDVTAIDMTGWSYDDDSATPATVDLSAFGVVAPGESVVLTEDDAAVFATDWGLSGVVIIGGLTANIGRGDQVNLFDAGGVLADRITYGDQVFPGTIRTQESSGWPCDTAVGADNIVDWFLSFAGDPQSSFASTNGDVGNPGTFALTGCEFCGNLRLDSGEICDGGGCCNPNCTVAAADTVCRAASGACDPEEICDGIAASCPDDGMITVCQNGDGCCPAACDANNDAECPAVCGNAVTEPGEECDDGNVADGDGCSGACIVEVSGVPAVSEWGLAILLLVGLTIGTTLFRPTAKA